MGQSCLMKMIQILQGTPRRILSRSAQRCLEGGHFTDCYCRQKRSHGGPIHPTYARDVIGDRGRPRAFGSTFRPQNHPFIGLCQSDADAEVDGFS